MKCSKKKNSTIIEFLKVLIWPIIFIIGQFLIITLFCLIKGLIDGNDDYSSYINSNTILITIITFLIFFTIFYKKYNKYKKDYNNKIDFKTIIFIILFGIILSFSYNIIINIFNNIYHFTDSYNAKNMDLLTLIVCTSLIGPILEEFIFRGYVYNKLKEFNPNMKSIILTCIIFALFHNSFVQILYTFYFGFILIYVYEKYKTIKAPIILHVSSNLANTLYCYLIYKNINYNEIIVLIVSLLLLLVINNKIIKIDLNVEKKDNKC